ncbi:acyl carrier protein [Saccharopolyspora sp. NPDC003752]|uniref:acyl carrier protein n=1 Tax=Saccharopolyspora sp. NPDC050389 TaxID=3155516 RepID=UPI0033FB0AAB
MAAFTVSEIENWLAEKIGYRLGVPASEVDTEQYFDEFSIESNEALVLAGELESWLGMELETTALWYHPTISQLARYIVEEAGKHVA